MGSENKKLLAKLKASSINNSELRALIPCIFSCKAGGTAPHLISVPNGVSI